MFLMLIPGFNVVYGIITGVRFGIGIGRSGGFGFLLLCFPYVGYPIIAIQGFVWRKKGLSRQDVVNERKVDQFQKRYGQYIQQSYVPWVSETSVPVSSSANSFCSSCGARIVAGQHFCEQCGSSVDVNYSPSKDDAT